MNIFGKWVTEEIREGISKLLNKNEKNTSPQNYWDIAKVVLRGKFGGYKCLY